MNRDGPMQLLALIYSYVENLSAPPDPALKVGPRRLREAGMPEINVSSNEGRLRQSLAGMSGNGIFWR